MIKKIASLIILVFLTSSCTLYHITSESTTDDYYPRNDDYDVVFIENIDQEYVSIGIITINAERRQRINNVIKKMKREAAVLGGDAIINIKSDATGTWKKLPVQQTIGNAYVRANFTAEVIVLE